MTLAGRVALESLEPRQLLAGELVSGFGPRGIVSLGNASPPVDVDVTDAQSGGKVLVTFANGTIRRYHENGSLDTAFANDGVLDSGIDGRGLAITPAGRLIVGGSVNRQWAIERYNPDGSPDNTFGTNGRVVRRIGTAHDEFPRNVQLAADGKIVLAGTHDNDIDPDSFYPHPWDVAVAKFNPDGSPDTTFAGDGEFLTSEFDDLQTLAVAPNGNVVIGGATNIGQSTHTSSWIVLGTAGQVVDKHIGQGTGGFTSDRIDAAAFTRGNALLLGDEVFGNANVSLEGGGRNLDVDTPVFFDPLDREFWPNAKIYDIVVQSDGRAFLVGFGGDRRNGSGVMRLDDGQPDQTFGLGGMTVHNFKKRKADWITNAALTPQEDLIVVGQIGGNPHTGAGPGRYFMAKIRGGDDTPGGREPLASVSTLFPDRPVAGQTTPVRFKVTYAAQEAIVPSTLGDFDLLVRGPRGYITRAKFLGATDRYDDRHQIAEYSIAPPGGTWDAADAGKYSVSVRKRQVRDNFQHFVRPGHVGTLRLIVSPAAPQSTPATAARPFSRSLIAPAPANRDDDVLLKSSDSPC